MQDGKIVAHCGAELLQWFVENEITIGERFVDVKPYPLRFHTINDPAQLVHYQLRWK